MTHEVRVNVKRYAVVVFEELEVANQVHYQEGAEKQARQGHDNLAPNAAGKGFCKPIHKNISQKRAT
jgi:hypothetical protein